MPALKGERGVVAWEVINEPEGSVLNNVTYKDPCFTWCHLWCDASGLSVPYDLAVFGLFWLIWD